MAPRGEANDERAVDDEEEDEGAEGWTGARTMVLVGAERDAQRAQPQRAGWEAGETRDERGREDEATGEEVEVEVRSARRGARAIASMA